MKDNWVDELYYILDGFKTNIESINNYIEFIKKSEHVLSISNEILLNLGNGNRDILKEHFSQMDIFLSSDLSYNTVIIALSSCFEQYFDTLLVDVIKRLEKLYKYSQLPKDIKKKNISAIYEYIESPTKFVSSFEIDDILSTQYSNKEDNYNLQAELMAEHTANLRYCKINELVNSIGIKNFKERLMNSPIFKGDLSVYIEQKTGIKRYEGHTGERLFADLENLIEDRNQVAHKWTVDQRSDISIIQQTYVKFISMFGECIFQVFLSYIIEVAVQNNKLANLGEIILVPSQNKKVACINSGDNEITCDKYIYFKDTRDYFFYSSIRKIQIDHRESNEAPKNTNVGIELNYEISKKYKLYIERAF